MKITIVGDSFTKGFLVDESYARLLAKAGFDVKNISENGANTLDCLNMYKDKKTDDEDLLIVFAGINDFYQNYSVEFAYKNVKSILKLSQARMKMIILAPYIEEDRAYSFYKMINEKIDSFDEKLKSLAYPFVDARLIEGRFIDGLHRAGDFHRNLSKEIKERIKEVKNQ